MGKTFEVRDLKTKFLRNKMSIKGKRNPLLNSHGIQITTGIFGYTNRIRIRGVSCSNTYTPLTLQNYVLNCYDKCLKIDHSVNINGKSYNTDHNI